MTNSSSINLIEKIKEKEIDLLITEVNQFTRSIFMVTACAEPSYRSPIPITAADWTYRKRSNQK
jgi:dTDP-glucose pyrophosphorylase